MRACLGGLFLFGFPVVIFYKVLNIVHVDLFMEEILGVSVGGKRSVVSCLSPNYHKMVGSKWGLLCLLLLLFVIPVSGGFPAVSSDVSLHASVVPSPERKLSVDVYLEFGLTGYIIDWSIKQSQMPANYSIYVNGSLLVSNQAVPNSKSIEVLLDGFVVGFHNVSVLVQNDLGIGECFYNVYILPSEVPSLHAPSVSVEYEVGTSGHFVVWNVSDYSIKNYTVYRTFGNLTDVVDQQTFVQYAVGSVDVVLNVDGFAANSLVNYTIEVFDFLGQGNVSTILVMVTENLPPELISLPSLSSYVFNSTGNVLTWDVEDSQPYVYEIYRNGSLLINSSWSGGSVSLNVDNLPVGVYNFTLVLEDVFGIRAGFSHLLEVLPIPTTSLNVSFDPIITFGDVVYLNGSWLDLAGNPVSNASIQVSVLYSGFEVFNVSSILNSTGHFELSFVPSYVGNYSIVVDAMQSGFVNQTFHGLFEVVAISTANLTVSGPTSLFVHEVGVYTGSWKTVSGSGVPFAVIGYELANGTAVATGSYTTDEAGSFSILIDFAQIGQGNFTLAIWGEVYGYVNRSVSFPIEVKVIPLALNIISEPAVRPGMPFTIYVEVNPMLSLKSQGSSPSTANLTVKLHMELSWLNGSTGNISLISKTNETGIAEFVLLSDVTEEIIGINSMSAETSGSFLYGGSSSSVSSNLLPVVVRPDPTSQSPSSSPQITPSPSESVEVRTSAAENNIGNTFDLGSPIFVGLATFVLIVLAGLLIFLRHRRRAFLFDSLRLFAHTSLLVLQNRSGVPLVEYSRDLKFEPSLVSGMNSAFVSFMAEINDRESAGLHILRNRDMTIIYNQLENTGLVFLARHEPSAEILERIAAGHASAEYLLASMGIDPSDPIAFYRDFNESEIPLDFCLNSIGLQGLPVYVFRTLEVVASSMGFFFRIFHRDLYGLLLEISSRVTFRELVELLVDRLGISEERAVLQVHSLYEKGILRDVAD